MAATIDKGSFRAQATDDPNVFVVSFDFTDDVVSDANTGWMYTWKTATFRYNKNISATERTALIQAAIQLARRPGAETVIETFFKDRIGIAVVRTNPVVPEVYQKVETAPVS